MMMVFPVFVKRMMRKQSFQPIFGWANRQKPAWAQQKEAA
jgi:hypothetical protein